MSLCGLIVLMVSVTPGVVSSRSSHMPLRGLIVLTVSITPGMVSLRSSLMPLRGLVVLVVSVMPGVVSSWSSHMPSRGLVVLAISVTPGMVSSWSSHTPLRGLVVLVGFSGRSAGHGLRGRSAERDNMRLRSIALYTTGNMRSSHHTTPVGFPSFPLLPKVKHHTKEIVTTCGRTERSHNNRPSYPAKI